MLTARLLPPRMRGVKTAAERSRGRQGQAQQAGRAAELLGAVSAALRQLRAAVRFFLRRGVAASLRCGGER